jgi:hypothetical protein
MILVWHVLEGSMASFLRRWSKILFPVLHRSMTNGVDVVHMLGVAVLIVIVVGWPSSFVMR